MTTNLNDVIINLSILLHDFPECERLKISDLYPQYIQMFDDVEYSYLEQAYECILFGTIQKPEELIEYEKREK